MSGPTADLWSTGRASLEGFVDDASFEAQTFRESRAHFDLLLGPLQPWVARSTQVERNDAGDITRLIPGTTNVEVTQEGRIFVEQFGAPKNELDEVMSPRQREALIGFMANATQSTPLTQLSSRLRCDMPYYDARVQAFGPPVAFWTLIIRVHGPLLDLDYYLQQGIITARQRGALRDAIAAPKRERPNIAIFGSVDTGKTTFLAAIGEEMRKIAPGDRQIIIQDTREIKSLARNKEFLMFGVEQAHHEATGQVMRYEYSAVDVLNDYLRANGTRVIFGEARSSEAARGLLLAMNTGATGLATTAHSDSALDGMYRLEDLMRLQGAAPSRRMMARFVNMLAFMEKDERTGRRYMSELVRVRGVDDSGEYVTERI